MVKRPSSKQRSRSKRPSSRGPSRPHGPRPTTHDRRSSSDRPLGRILSIGDEIILGRCVDTNAAHIARWMSDHGLAVDLVQAVGDGQAAIASAMRRAADGAALVVCTGGLGPTDDDRTRHALADAMGVDIAEHAPSWKAIQAYFARGGRGPVPTVNRRQALLPRGARPLANDRGTAPGMLGRVGRCAVACLPGVPHEMVAMLERLSPLLPRLAPGLAPPSIAEVWFAGIGESTAQELIGGLLTERDPQVGITVSELGHITLRVVGARAQVAERARELSRAIAPHLLPKAGVAPSLVSLLAERRLTITASESCTCGHIAAAIGAVPGTSSVLRESFVSYHPDAKRDRVGVDPALLAAEGAVSEACARAMAEGALRAAGADIAVSATGIAGPDGGTAECPVGTVWVGVADARGSEARRHLINGGRERVQRRAAVYALLLAWQRLVRA